MLREIKKTIWLVLISLALFTQLSWAGVNIPDWMRQAASQPIGKYEPKTKAVILLDQKDITVTAAGDYVEHYRRVEKILRPEGRREGEFGIVLEDRDKLLSLHAWTTDAAGHDYEIKEKDFAEVSPYDDELYMDIRARYAKAPAADPGSVIAFEYEVRRHVWINEFNWGFQEEVPIRELDISLTLPPGWEYKSSWSGVPAVSPTQTGDGRWLWTLRDVSAIDSEPMMPAFETLAGRFELAYFGNNESSRSGSWDAIGRWYIGLAAGRRDANPEITAKARELTANKANFDGKLRALASFLQAEVRYVEISIGVGGWQPHAASATFHARYGDCKDKATLLSSLLGEVGIKSDYLVIDTHRGFVNPLVPSTWFNHVILAIQLPQEIPVDTYHSVITAKAGKRYLIFDPTDEWTPVGELNAGLQDSYALLVTDSGGELIRTPLLSPETNTLTRTGHFTLDPTGAISGEVQEDRTGDHAWNLRARLLRANQQERTQELEHRLNRSLDGFSIQSSDIQQLDQIQKNLILSFKFITPQFAQLRGPLMLVRPRILGEKSYPIDTKPRHYPIQLEGTSHETDTYEIEIPQGYMVDDVPDPVNIDIGFASYRSKVETNGSKVRYWREYIVRDPKVDTDHFSDWRKLQGVIGADEAAAVVLKRTP